MLGLAYRNRNPMLALGLELDQAEDDVGVAFARAAQGAKLVDDVGLEPDEAFDGLTTC
jgi:hypothetical protein